jgi:hypothetical protein
VLELDRRQPEFTQSWAQYRDARLSPTRIDGGRCALDLSLPHLAPVRGHGVCGIAALPLEVGACILSADRRREERDGGAHGDPCRERQHSMPRNSGLRPIE